MPDDPLTPGRAAAHTVLSAVVAAVLVAAVALAWSSSVTRQQTRAAAEAEAIAVVDAIVEPLVTPALVAGDPDAHRRLERAVAGRLRDGSIARVKLWSADGRVVFSDEPRLVGRRFAQDPVAVTATVSALTARGDDENLYERVFPQLVEVYVPLGQVGDTDLVFEAYFPADGFAAADVSPAGRVLLLAGVGLVLVLAVQVPQTLRLARRLRQQEEVREALHERIAAARAEERERWASGMRDSVLQDLAGLGYLLDSVGPDLPDEKTRDLVGRAGDVLRSDLSLLRRIAHGDLPVPPVRG